MKTKDQSIAEIEIFYDYPKANIRDHKHVWANRKKTTLG